MIPLYATAITAGWVGLALAGGVDAGGVTTGGGLTIGPLAAAAAAGAAAAAASLAGRRGPVTAVSALLVLPVAVALAAAGHSAVPLVVAAAGLVAAEVARAPRRSIATLGPIVLATVGVGSLVAALVLSLGDLNPGELGVESETAAWLLAGGVGALLLAAALAPPGPSLLGLLVPPAVVVAWVVAPRLDGLALGAAAATALAAAVSRRPAPVLALAAVAVAALGPARPAAALLAAAAVLAVGVDHPAAALAGLPGAAAFAALAAAGTVTAEVGAAALAVGLAALATARWARAPVVLDAVRVPAAALLVWLVLAPGTWRWTGRAPLATYELGAARATAAGLLAVVAAWALGQVRPRMGWNSEL